MTRNRTGALVALAAAFVLLGSWFVPGFAQMWDALDAWVFYTLNGWVGRGTPFAELAALTGDRRFDVVAALIVFMIFTQRFLRGDPEELRRGLAFGIFTALLLLVVLKLQREVPMFPRQSPSLVLEPWYSIQAYVPWSRAKEVAETSFPGDHATVMLLITWLWWRAAGWRMGLVALALSVAFTVPRFVAGAHWITDLAIGSVFSTLLAVALLTGTPAGRWLYALADRVSGWLLGIWSRTVERFGRDGLFEPPKRQIVRGMCIGTADLIPGVSGGTMALILGVYQRLLGAIARVDGALVRMLLRGRIVEGLRRLDILFIAPLAIGMLLALIIFSRVIPMGVVIAEWPEMTFGLFFGLIAASIVSMLLTTDERRLPSYGWLLGGAVLGTSVVLIVPASTPDDLWFLFLCGMITVAAMLMPGVSGAFVLLLLGKYADAIDALGRLDFAFLLPLAAGALTGAILFSRLVTWLLARYRRQTMLTVIGILGGSLLAVWPFQEWIYEEVGGRMRLVSSTAYVPQVLDWGVFLGILMMVVGVAAFFLLERLARRRDDDTPAPAAIRV